ncbi:GAF and ANTAR domain-containing protein [Terrabacter terrae]|uniref:GAF and ANTAR domain-containing protein n=1 Tax=Terrabacter terrae TaxID=318434 RepID=A0ABP5FTJ1_9MICO
MSRERPRPVTAAQHRLEPDFRDLGGLLGGPESPVSPARLVEVASRMVPHAQHAAVTLLREHSRPTTVAATDELPGAVDRLQYETREGPCLEASEGHRVVVSGDLSAEPRWPAFSGRCASELGVHSILSVMLSLSGGDRAALNLYASEVHAYGDDDVAVGAMLAPFVALSVEQSLHRKDVDNLEQALATSRQIGTAVGILMSQYRLSDDQAFALLRKVSQNMNRKLRDVAEEVTYSGELPLRVDADEHR